MGFRYGYGMFHIRFILQNIYYVSVYVFYQGLRVSTRVTVVLTSSFQEIFSFRRVSMCLVTLEEATMSSRSSLESLRMKRATPARAPRLKKGPKSSGFKH